MFILTKELKDFSAAHRLIGGYSGKCRTLHGHNYKITVTIGAQQLDENGFVTEFSLLTKLCNKWIEQNLDHSIIISHNDASLFEFSKREKQKYYILNEAANSTVENIAKEIFNNFMHIIRDNFRKSVEITKVEVWETPRSSAIYSSNSVVSL